MCMVSMGLTLLRVLATVVEEVVLVLVPGLGLDLDPVAGMEMVHRRIALLETLK